MILGRTKNGSRVEVLDGTELERVIFSHCSLTGVNTNWISDDLIDGMLEAHGIENIKWDGQ